jgi:hypothetical protein
VKCGSREVPGLLLPCLLRLRELGYVEAWCHDEPKPYMEVDELLVRTAAEKEEEVPTFFVDGCEIHMYMDPPGPDAEHVLAYRGTKLCPRGGLS